MGLISNVLNGMLSNKSEAFQSFGEKPYFKFDIKTNIKYVGVLGVLFLFVILFIFFYIAKVLWNNVGCRYITILKPVNSVFDIICISIFFSIMRLL